MLTLKQVQAAFAVGESATLERLEASVRLHMPSDKRQRTILAGINVPLVRCRVEGSNLGLHL